PSPDHRMSSQAHSSISPLHRALSSPAPVGTRARYAGGPARTTTTHFPSGDISEPVPSPSLFRPDPSKLRKYMFPLSLIRSVFPSGEIDTESEPARTVSSRPDCWPSFRS